MSDSDAYVSTGRLAPAPQVRRILAAVHTQVASVRSGENSQIYPPLAQADPDRFGSSVVGTDGQAFECGDALAEFAMMSVAKPRGGPS